MSRLAVHTATTESGRTSRGAPAFPRPIQSLARGASVVGAAALLLAWSAGCAWPPDLQVPEGVPRPQRFVVVLFVDGLSQVRLNELLDRGELPAIREVFVDGGVSVEHGVACLPPVTYPASVSLLTGLLPPHHGIVGNEWFDRRDAVYQDYCTAATFRRSNHDFAAPTLFDLLDDQRTISIQCHTRRGASRSYETRIFNALDMVLRTNVGIDRRTVDLFGMIDGDAAWHGRWPAVCWLYFPAIDQIGHAAGPDSPAYADAIRHIDVQIGRLRDSIRQAGLTDQTYLVLVTDHGHVALPAARGFDVQGWLKEHRGLRCYSGLTSGSADHRRRILDGYDAVLLNGAYRRAMLHLRGRGGWKQDVGQDEVEAFLNAEPRLIDQPAIELVLTRGGPNRARLRSRYGSCDIERRGSGREARYRASSIEGDPLRVGADAALGAFVAAGWHSSREWLAATDDAVYPDFVPQAVALFDTHRTGEVVMFAADDWSLGGCEAGGHGSCIQADMRTPMFFAGPGLPRGGRVGTARVVDLMPTVLDMLGFSDRLERLPALDGESVLGQLRGAAMVKQ